MDEPALAPQPRLPHAASLPPAGTGMRPLFAGVWRHVLRRGLSATPTRARWLRCTSSHGRRHNPRPTARRPHPSTRTDTRSQLLVSVLPSQLGRLLAFTVRDGPPNGSQRQYHRVPRRWYPPATAAVPYRRAGTTCPLAPAGRRCAAPHARGAQACVHSRGSRRLCGCTDAVFR